MSCTCGGVTGPNTETGKQKEEEEEEGKIGIVR